MVEIIVLGFIVVISAILGLAIFQNNPKSATNIAFGISAITIIFWAIVMYLSVNTASLDGTLFYIRLSMVAGTVMALAFLLLGISFPETKVPLAPKYLFLLGLAGVVTCIISMSPYMFTGLVVEGSNIEPTVGWGIISFVITSLGSNLATFVVLIVKFLRSKGRIKEQLRFIVIGTLVMFALLIAGNFFAVIILKTSSFIFLGPLFTLTFLVSVAYAILKHHLLDIRALVARAVTYSILIALVVLMEASIVFAGASLLPATVNQNFIAIAGSLFIVMTYSTLNSLITRATDKIFFQGRYDQEDVLKLLTNIMVREVDIHKLSAKLLKVLVEEIKLVGAGFVLIQDGVISSTHQSGFPRVLNLQSEAIQDLIGESRKALIFEELKSDNLKELFRTYGISIIIPLFVKDVEVGILILGPKSSGDIYAERDLEFFEIFAPQAAIALKNASSYLEIQEFNKTLENKVEERTKELEKAQASELAIKDEFVFIATHDLATPVTAISGFTAMINERKEKMSSELRTDLTAITEASSRLKVLVNDLLQVARSDSGTIKVDLAPVDIGPILESAVRQVSPMAQDKKVKVELSLGKTNTVKADAKKLSEVFENLISNGVKYNVEGGKLQVSTSVVGKKLVIEFKDSGLGIPESEQGKVFSKFFRSEAPEVRQRPGTGLGLFVVRMLIQKMNGKIAFESKVGKGTTFWIFFNL